jgi:hypothetical protein
MSPSQMEFDETADMLFLIDASTFLNKVFARNPQLLLYFAASRDKTPSSSSLSASAAIRARFLLNVSLMSEKFLSHCVSALLCSSWIMAGSSRWSVAASFGVNLPEL